MHGVTDVNGKNIPPRIPIRHRDAGRFDALGEEPDGKAIAHHRTVFREKKADARVGAPAQMRRPCLVIAPARAERYNLRGSRCRKFAGFELFHFGVLLLQEKI